MKLSRLLIAVLLSSISYTQLCQAQTKINHEKNQIWIGYMTKTALKGSWSLWNDFHFATENFFVSRHGITYDFNSHVALTAGYAWGLLAPSFTTDLKRFEHRPWAQIVFGSEIGEGWQTQQRIRYDARFKETVKGSEIIDGEYDFNHRLRYMFNIRRKLNGNILGNKNTFLSANNEILLNFGKEIKTNNLDQYRASLFFGYPTKWATFQLGYMYRYQPTSNYNYTHYHDITLWINQTFGYSKK